VKLEKYGIHISNSSKIVLIAGPCVIESKELTLSIASTLKKIAEDLDIPFIFKASYDKANRSSIASFRGPGLKKGIEILKKVKEKLRVPVLTDVHSVSEVPLASGVADILQIPAFLCRQTDLVVACAKTGLGINIKKGQFMAADDMPNIIKKAESVSNRRIMLTERGTTFGYHNLVVDTRSITIMKKTGYPVVFDATHSVQLPGQKGGSSGGQREFILPLSLACTSLGLAGIFVEVHPDPKKALSDGANSLSLKELPSFLKQILALDNFIKGQ
jgi:2-dehydro-3-deoxyphosphooctonate aldolase (KDO 8-P synthase)